MLSQRVLIVLLNAIHLLFWIPFSTSQDEEFFIESPSNTTAIQGDSVVLKCKTNATILHNCQWFYLESGLNMFDPHITPKLVKQFQPNKMQDCSIRLKKVRLIQTGQWICKGFRGDTKQYAITNPAFLEVLQSSDDVSTKVNYDTPSEIEEHTVIQEERPAEVDLPITYYETSESPAAAFEPMKQENKRLNSQQTADEYSVYGEHIASQLRNLRNEYVEAVVRFKIDQILHNATRASFLFT